MLEDRDARLQIGVALRRVDVEPAGHDDRHIRSERNPAPVRREGVQDVWDFPRPPAVVACERRARVEVAGVVVADSAKALYVLETSHPPTLYVPPEDVRGDVLVASDARGTTCEFKGRADYLDVVAGGHRRRQVA
jgi:uncharacterized protein (DUF427 family)